MSRGFETRRAIACLYEALDNWQLRDKVACLVSENLAHLNLTIIYVTLSGTLKYSCSLNQADFDLHFLSPFIVA